MRYLHNAVISVFAKEGEDALKIKERLVSLVPFSLEEEGIKVREQVAEGFNEKKIRIFEVVLEKEKHLNRFIEMLRNSLSDEQRELLLRQRESRLDAGLNFFIRLDKEKLLEGKFFIIDGGNCFHIKMAVAAFPAKRQPALEVIDKIFK